MKKVSSSRKAEGMIDNILADFIRQEIEKAQGNSVTLFAIDSNNPQHKVSSFCARSLIWRIAELIEQNSYLRMNRMVDCDVVAKSSMGNECFICHITSTQRENSSLFDQTFFFED